ncbi:Streptococcal surface protein A [Labeo rohita]|uniref:Streptococcal surface protein A n=1 Tax=Labeo rohita TaxID=84645 RepID=A0ABQ8L3A8_LABRO|nr:Streptococcal surface protein A [Labeo rohita]
MSQETAVHPESRHFTTDLQKPHHIAADHQEPHTVSADIPEPCHVSSHLVVPTLLSHAEPTLPSHMPTASTPSSPAGIPLSTVLPVIAVAILSVWATHCTPESLSVHESAPESLFVRESVPEASHVHEFAPVPPESTPEISSDHKSAPVPPEVATPAAEPPKRAPTSYELSAHPVTTMEANHEFSACSVTAKELVHEHSALLWGFLLSSALLWWSSASPWKSSDSSVPLWRIFAPVCSAVLLGFTGSTMVDFCSSVLLFCHCFKAQVLQCFTVCHCSTIQFHILCMDLAHHPTPWSTSVPPPTWTVVFFFSARSRS